MLRELIRPIILFPLLLILIVLGVLLHSSGHESAGSERSSGNSANPLTVSGQGAQTTTNVDGGALQQAAPPSHSVTNTSVTPQQAAPYTTQ